MIKWWPKLAENIKSKGFSTRKVVYFLLSLLSLLLIIVVYKYWLNNQYWFDDNTLFLGRPLWDWIELLVVPIALSSTGFFIRGLLEKREDERKQHEAFKDYLDDITELFLSDNLQRGIQAEDKSDCEKSKVTAIARARTLAALDELDKSRQVQVIRFLSEANELRYFQFPGERSNFSKSNLAGAQLYAAIFRNAHLEEANLFSVNLTGALLEEACLEKAYLEGAILRNANFRKANLSGSDLTRARLEKAHLAKAHLKNVNFYRRLVVRSSRINL